MWFIFKLGVFFILYTHLEFSLEFLKTLIPLCHNQGNGHLKTKDSLSASCLPGNQFQRNSEIRIPYSYEYTYAPHSSVLTRSLLICF